jgi:hypothetical protein
MKNIIYQMIYVTLLMSSTGRAATPEDINQNQCKAEAISSDRLRPVACQSGRTYELQYVKKSGRIVLTADGKQHVLHRIPKGYDPSLVGADSAIGFLPDALQLYKAEQILLYTSSARTTSGTGGGQCGSGAEIYLNFLDVSATTPKLRSRILISSCERPIELMDQNISDGRLEGFSVVGNRLSLHFLFYEEQRGYPTATISSDFKKLVFKRKVRG